MKTELIKYLKGKTNYIFDIHSLWGETKNYYKSKGIEMGGSFASIGEDISVILNVNNELIRFKVSLLEVK